MDKQSYIISNQIENVCLNKFSKKYSENLLSDKNRLHDGKMLLDYLCEKFKIPYIKKLVVLDKPRKKVRNGILHGYYVSLKNEIYIYNITSVTHKQIAIKQFYETLLHEFMHHYDITKLKLKETNHTSGFYKRISDLQKKL